MKGAFGSNTYGGEGTEIPGVGVLGVPGTTIGVVGGDMLTGGVPLPPEGGE